MMVNTRRWYSAQNSSRFQKCRFLVAQLSILNGCWNVLIVCRSRLADGIWRSKNLPLIAECSSPGASFFEIPDNYFVLSYTVLSSLDSCFVALHASIHTYIIIYIQYIYSIYIYDIHMYRIVYTYTYINISAYPSTFCPFRSLSFAHRSLKLQEEKPSFGMTPLAPKARLRERQDPLPVTSA